jgi:TusE/DsrC/DsvC family sulfur relay protein
MFDINKAVEERETGGHDPEGHMYDLPHWSRELAMKYAKEEGIDELSEKQWQLIFRLRGLYRKHGQAKSARQIMNVLEKEFQDEGGRRYLYQLFPKGPISQGCRLAGLPAPPYSSDPSFGTVQ